MKKWKIGWYTTITLITKLQEIRQKSRKKLCNAHMYCFSIDSVKNKLLIVPIPQLTDPM